MLRVILFTPLTVRATLAAIFDADTPPCHARA